MGKGSLIDQAFLVWYMRYCPIVRSRWPDISQVLVCIFMDQQEMKINKTVKEKEKKKRGKYPAILAEQALSIHDFISGQRVNFLPNQCGKTWAARWAHLVSSGSQSEHRIWFLLQVYSQIQPHNNACYMHLNAI